MELIKLIAAPVGKCWMHHRGINESMETLNKKLEELHSRKEDTELRMKAELLPGKTPRKEVQHWFKNAENINIETKAIKDRVEEVNCFCGARLGKIVSKRIQEVGELHKMGEFHNGLV